MTKARTLASFDATGVLTSTSTLNPALLDDTGTIPSALLAGVGGDNTPSFFASIGTAAAIPANVWSTVIYNTEAYDTASAYNNSTYIFTPQTAGKYFCSAQIKVGNFGDGAGSKYIQLALYKNGDSTQEGYTQVEANGETVISVSSVITFNGSSDNLKVRVYHNDGASARNSSTGIANSFFTAFKLAE